MRGGRFLRPGKRAGATFKLQLWGLGGILLFGHVGGQTRSTHKRMGRDQMALGGALALGAFVQAGPPGPTIDKWEEGDLWVHGGR